MCGIVGMISLDKSRVIDKESIKLMNAKQKHRGPDGEGIWINEDKNCGLGQVRLSIIDLSGGKQPMTGSCGNTITFNGEIYNYKKLKSELNEYNFQTNSDTEVLLAAYQKCGVDCVNHLQGMFSFAIWDERRKIFFCARDFIGIKPFFYTIQNNVFYFASEIKSLTQFLSGIEINEDGMKDYLTLQLYMDNKTLFKNIHSLGAGHYIVIDGKDVNIKQYWDASYETNYSITESSAIEKTKELVENSVKLHMESDVPIAGYVSGGMDSSTISVMTYNMSKNKQSFSGYCGSFNENPEFNESEWASIVANECNIPLNVYNITAEDFISQMKKAIYHLDMPHVGYGLYGNMTMSREVAKKYKVILGGQGGDELFGGYGRHLVFYFEHLLKNEIDQINDPREMKLNDLMPSIGGMEKYKNMLSNFLGKDMWNESSKRYFTLIDKNLDQDHSIKWGDFSNYYSSFDEYEKIFNNKKMTNNSVFDKILYFEKKVLLPALLSAEDRLSMAYGVESRVPFVERELIDFVSTIPVHIKLKNGQLKYLLRQVAKNVLPEKVLNRKDKMGFACPFNFWIQNQAKDIVLDILKTGQAKKRPFVDYTSVINKIENNQIQSYDRVAWGLLALEMWFCEFFGN